MPTYLTKSKFTQCLECPTKLYYKNHEEEYVTSQDDNDFLQALAEGGMAMMAWARMQFDDVPENEREQVFEALLRYCELDTLAIVMIYQHWESMKNQS